MRSVRLVAVVAVSLLAFVSAACGSGSGGSSSGSGSDASTWNIGGIGSCSGADAATHGGDCKTLAAWARSVNDAGGINGHKINLIVKDDGGNATTSTTLVHELVEQDHVIAIVGDLSEYSASWASYVDRSGIPVVGGLPVESAFVSDPNFYGIGMNLVALQYASMQEVLAHGYHTAGYLYCAEVPACAQSVPLLQAAGKLAGVSIVAEKVAGNAPDFTAQCVTLKDGGAQVFEVGAGSGTAARVLDACRAQGVTARLFATDGTFTASWLQDKNTDGTFGAELVAPWFDTRLPAIQQYQDAMRKYAPDVYNSAQFGPSTTYAWISGKLFEAAATAGDLGANPTPADVKRGLYALKGETLGGLTAPLTYTSGQPSFIPCYFPVGIENGQFVAPNGATPTCIPPEKLKPFLSQAGG